MTRNELTELYFNFLQEEGYRPTVDDDGDLLFKAEGKTFIIFVNEEDPTFFRLVFPNFWPIEDEDEYAKVLDAANLATARTKVTKIYSVNDNVWASAEVFVPEIEDFKKLFGRCMDALRVGFSAFVAIMREQSLN